MIRNNIPSDLRNLPKKKFKRTSHKGGTYVDLATLINTLKNKLN